jgi:putative membrane protein
VTRERWALTAAVGAGATSLAMIALPLAAPRGTARRVISSVVVTGMFVTTAANTVRRWGTLRAATASAVVGAGTAAVERVGTRTGFPFGSYDYTDALRPRIGGVPVIVPLAWFAMAVPARETAHAALGERSTPVKRVVVGSLALTAWDLFLDPQMVGEGYWTWARQGRYRGIPLTNYAGWFLTGLVVMAALEVLLPPTERTPDAPLVGEFTFMGLMETVGFLAFFGDRTVGITGGSAMLPIAAAAVARWRRGPDG